MKNNLFFNKGVGVFLPLFIFILFIQLVSAAPPVTTVQQFSTGYAIEVPSQDYIIANSAFKYNIHVYNISNGVPKTSGIGCYLHAYNSSGSHIAELYVDTVTHNFDYEFNLNAANFSKTGQRRIVTQCNSSVLGGYTERAIEVKSSPAIVGTNGASFFWIFIVLSSGLIIFGLWKQDPTITILGGFATTFLGLYIMFNGIDLIKNDATNAVALIILMIGGYIALRSSYELMRDNM